MDNVVDIKSGNGNGGAPGRRLPRRRQRRRADKTALVLGGGGFTGGVYEIGALRALDLLAVNSTINDFDIYVGTSAGSFVGSLVANGVTPEEMMRVLNADLASPIPDVELGDLLTLNVGEIAQKSAKFPLRAMGLMRELAGNLSEVSVVDVLLGLAGGLPTGAYSGRGIESYVAEVLSDPDRTDSFDELKRELYITATDLDSTERVVLGHGDWADVPISLAVRASTALPMVYEPVRIHERDFIDGGIRSTTNVDVAVENGAKFIVVINPLVPFVNDFSKEIPTLTGSRARRVADMGFAAVANQTFRLLSHDRLHRAAAYWESQYPGVDFILIEPELDDELMFGTSILDYRARLDIARHGFESVTRRLARDFDQFGAVAERHGIEISERRLRHVLDEAGTDKGEGEERLSAWRRVLEQTTQTVLRNAPASGE